MPDVRELRFASEPQKYEKNNCLPSHYYIYFCTSKSRRNLLYDKIVITRRKITVFVCSICNKKTCSPYFKTNTIMISKPIIENDNKLL